MPVTWSLYHWSQNDQANFITSKSDKVTIPSGKTAKVSFVVNDSDHPVYLLQVWRQVGMIPHRLSTSASYARARTSCVSISPRS